MSEYRKPRRILSLSRACYGFLLCLATLPLVACQLAIPLQETTAPAPVKHENPTSTETSPPPPREREPASAGLIQLLDPIDEPEYYCVDVPGFGRSLNLKGDLTAHTCKPGADDEMFLFNSPVAGQISMPAYDLCVEASGEEPGSTLQLAGCSDAALQQFRYDDNGQIRLELTTAAGELCLTVGPEPGEPTGGPSHLRRTLTLETCSQVDELRTLWTVGSPNVVTGEP
ncbi:MAG: RICIN domain-containing protein [Caldilineaceae bacterium SB0675_bin_29]|uniref:RICIN domain-containing protein n=1 Tax=Caldilineaceae bacterium SB0675_bin_29 TaxID=2605266 RepID=A0A6B1FZD3_9CHLR|nr:RICIN domain-containing protein [Caldilineaceae bacterium SB0675_bin_29]